MPVAGMRTGRPGARLRPSAEEGSWAFTPQKVGAEKRIRKPVGARAFLRPEGRAPSERRPLDAQFLPRAFAPWHLCVVFRFEVHFLPSRAFALPRRRGAGAQHGPYWVLGAFHPRRGRFWGWRCLRHGRRRRFWGRRGHFCPWRGRFRPWRRVRRGRRRRFRGRQRLRQGRRRLRRGWRRGFQGRRA